MRLFLAVLAAMVTVAPAQFVQVMSQQSCVCQTACAARIQVLNINLDHPACRIDRSVCGECPQSRCIGGVRLCLPAAAGGTCTPCYGGTLQCYDRCVPPGGANTILSNTIAAARSLATATIDNFNQLSTHVQELIAEEIQALPPQLQNLLNNATLFANATINELQQIGQDVLANAREVRTLVRSQVRGIVERLVDFTVENLDRFISHLNISVWRESIGDFGCISRWSPEQYTVLAERAVFAFGGTIGWTPNDIRRVGSLIRGLSAGNFSQLQPLAYEAALLTTSISTGGTLSRRQADGLAQRAVSIYSAVSSWNETQWRLVRSVARGLSRGDLGGVSLTVLNEVARVRNWNATQQLALVERVIFLAGNADNVTSAQWQEVAQMARGIATSRLQQLSVSGIYALGRASCAVGGVCLTEAQSATIVARTQELIGTVGSWTVDDWRRLGQNIRGLNSTQLRDTARVALPAIAGELELDPSVLNRSQLQVVAIRAVELLGDVGLWSEQDSQDLATIIVGMDSNQLGTLTLPQAILLSRVIARNPHIRLTPQQQIALALRLRQLRQGGQWNTTAIRELAALAPAMLPDIATMDGVTLLTLASAFSNVSERALPDGTILTADRAALSAMAERALQVLGPAAEYDAETWAALGAAGPDVLFRNLSAVITINTTQISALAGITGLSAEQRRAVRDRLVEVYGNVQQVPWSELGDLATGLSTGDLHNATEQVLDHLSTIGPGQCSTNVPCDPTYADWNISVAGTTLCPRQLLALGRRAVFFFGELQNWNASNFRRMGPLLRGLNEADIAKLPDVAFDYIGNVTCWNTDQLRCLARRAIQVVEGGQGLAQWTEATWERLGEVASGLDVDVLRNMTRSSFERAIGTLGQSHVLSRPQLEALATRAVELLGHPSTWDTETVARLGAVLGGLLDDFVEAIPPEVLAAGLVATINSSSSTAQPNSAAITALCTETKIHVFTPEQVGAVQAAGINMLADANCPAEALRYTEAQNEALEAASTSGSDGASSSGNGMSGGETAAVVICVLLIVAVVGVAAWKRERIQEFTRGGRASVTSAASSTQNNTYRAHPTELEAGQVHRPAKPTRQAPTRAAPVTNPVYSRALPVARPPPLAAPRPPPRTPALQPAAI